MYFTNCLQNTRLISKTYMLYTGVYREHQCIKLQAVYRTLICCISVIYLVLYCHASVCVIKSPKPAVIKYEFLLKDKSPHCFLVSFIVMLLHH